MKRVPSVCSICFTPLVFYAELSCGHSFHLKCLESWIKRKNNCPLCRKDDIRKCKLHPIEFFQRECYYRVLEEMMETIYLKRLRLFFSEQVLRELIGF